MYKNHLNGSYTKPLASIKKSKINNNESDKITFNFIFTGTNSIMLKQNE